MRRTPPDALLLLTSTCPFCPGVLKSLGDLVKTGDLGRLEAVNIERHPEVARQYGVRSVPWVKVGPFELAGSRSTEELKQWAGRAGTAAGAADYLRELLTTGDLARSLELAKKDAVWLDALALLATGSDTEMQVRVGIAAILEEMQGDAMLARLVEPLAHLAESDDARLRGDAAHYLALTRAAHVRPILERLVNDADAGVREIAAEGLAELSKDASS